MRPSTIAQVPPRKLTQPPQRWSPFGLSRYWADALLTLRRPRISCSSPSSNGSGVIGGAAHAGSAVPASAAPQRVFPIKLRREMDSFFECSLTGVLRGCGGTIRGLPDDQNNWPTEALFRTLPTFPLQRRRADRGLRPGRAKQACPPTESGQPYYLFFPPTAGGTEQDRSRSIIFSNYQRPAPCTARARGGLDMGMARSSST